MPTADELLGTKKSASDLLGVTQAKPAAPEMVPSYDPMGAATGYYEAAPPMAAKPMPYGEQMKELGRAALGYGKGTISQIAGAPGDVEAFARALYNATMRFPGKIQQYQADRLGSEDFSDYIKKQVKNMEDKVLISEEPYFKTTEQRGKQLFGEPKTPGEKVGRAFGEVLGLPTGIGLGKKAGVKLAEGLVGRTTETAGKIAREAEKLGFKLEPRQVRAKEPLGSPGFAGAAEKNQTLANRLASKATGVETNEISRDFVGKRLKELGKNYSEIFDRELKVDRALVDDLSAITDFEARVRPADVRSATQASNNLISAFTQAEREVGRPISAVKLDGREIQRLRNELSYIARTATVGDDRRIAGQFVEAIDNAIARNNKDLATKLADTNRQYAATKTLEEMIEKGTVFQGNISLDKLGDYVAANSYGFGSGTSMHPLSDLAVMGRELGIRGIFEGVQEPASEITQLLSKTGRFVAPLTRTQAARAAQRAISAESGLPKAEIATLPAGALQAAYDEQQKRKK